MGEEWISLSMISIHQAYNWTSHCNCGALLETNDYPLLQDSKGIIAMCMIISSLTSMWLVHIIHVY
jgi:hypothetical protein